MNRIILTESLQFYNMLPRTFFYTNNIMPTHYGGSGPMKSKMSRMQMTALSDAQYYKEHSKHHSAKHIRAMKDLQKMGVDREKAHSYVKKYVGK